MDTLSKAIELADKMTACNTDLELKEVVKEVKATLVSMPELMEWREWLLCVYQTANDTINTKPLSADVFNEKGKVWAKEKGLI